MMKLLSPLNQTAQELEKTFGQIPGERKASLEKLAAYIRKKKTEGQEVNLVFICTHNSRRSHLAQLWAQAAAAYYGLNQVHSFSGGTEATAFNPLALAAMQKLGFDIQPLSDGQNPVYAATYAEGEPALPVWSKVYTDAANPAANFLALMTCTEADGNCPFVEGADQRMALTYEDPKHFDGTGQEKEKYEERARQIGRELLYAFRQAVN
ncbi:MAG: protein-tyrosine-phosphatase [Adhaeribacter sp.]